MHQALLADHLLHAASPSGLRCASTPTATGCSRSTTTRMRSGSGSATRMPGIQTQGKWLGTRCGCSTAQLTRHAHWGSTPTCTSTDMHAHAHAQCSNNGGPTEATAKLPMWTKAARPRTCAPKPGRGWCMRINAMRGGHGTCTRARRLIQYAYSQLRLRQYLNAHKVYTKCRC